MQQSSITQNQFNTDDVGPWSDINQNYKSILVEFNQQQPTQYSGKEEKNKFITTKTSYSKLHKQNATTTCSEFPIRCIRNRVKSIDQPQRQLLKVTPVKQFCEFRISKELLIYRNTADFPKHNLPRNFLSFQKFKKSNERKKTLNFQEINPQLQQMQMQIKKMEEIIQQQKRYSREIGAKRLSNPKYQTFLNTLY
ncbi:unnamed protein product (macronuclear) [Paramecium tetraurelia]|uniref:Uncharacterized protein n=1 Tax=Paramecium tetraurelia TaxID=5888 RepID=A0DV96_PARTE|nr:uncharacterized protein GSPATT00020627001 [Paramecium tetraurelia]CAK86963.1 unnamed protein product [Paramecium tetraurelia]|eukprot:XP_001454360.1 hypothetical protein (macronuclear) [Paramecium tetraurelia strain d4-2]